MALGLGSAGSNRIRSAILQTVLRMVVDGMSAADAVRAARVHFEDDVVQAEPGIDEASLTRLEENGVRSRAGSAPTYISAEFRPSPATPTAPSPGAEIRDAAAPARPT